MVSARTNLKTAPHDEQRCWLSILGAAQNNLKSIDVHIPLGRFVCVTGVSGSGKSSLVNDILCQRLMRDLNGAENANPGQCERIDGLEHLDRVIDIDQSPIGRTPRSNPATYIKLFDLIRDLYTQVPDAKVRGYRAGRFSFNVSTGAGGGGRCEACEGNGATRLDMDFLADVWVTCPVCQGRRFSRETLQIHYKGKSITDVLEMDVQQALEHFAAIPKIAVMLQTLHDVGLDYLKLGQPSPTLSGGEAQRIKLARELVRKATGRTLYVLDEPTTGLHFDDIKRLLGVLQRLVDAGNSVVVVEHNLDVVKTADWVIDLGPEGGAEGGRIVAEGPPERIAASRRSYTGAALRAVLEERHEGTKARRHEGKGPRDQGTEEPRDSDSTFRIPRSASGQSAIRNPQSAIVETGSARLTSIRVVGARQHNLKDITVEVPREKMTVVSGVSGSGKSSFAIDTVYTEGQRRYVESLSAYARQFVGQLQKPDVEHIEGLSPAICIEQKSAGRSPRSTVGTVTEIYDYLRVLWARLGQPHCPKCRVPIGTQTSDDIVERVLALGEGAHVLLMAPAQRQGQESHEQMFKRARAGGYTRVRIDGDVVSLDHPPQLDHRREHRIEWIVDRLIVRRAQVSRLADSVEHALALGDGVMIAQIIELGGSPLRGETPSHDRQGAPEPQASACANPAAPHGEGSGIGDQGSRISEISNPKSQIRNPQSAIRNPQSAIRNGGEADGGHQLHATAGAEYRFSQHFACDRCGASYEELTPHHFSFNSRLGWCESCEGLGVQSGASPAAIVVRPTQSILDGAIAGWGTIAAGNPLHALACAVADHAGFDPNRPWNTLAESQRQTFLQGCGDDWIEIPHRAAGFSPREVPPTDNDSPRLSHEPQPCGSRLVPGLRIRWRGFYPAINRATRVSWQYRKRLEEFVTDVPCESCGGSRLRPDAAAVKLKGKTLHEICTLPLGEALVWFTNLKLDRRQRQISGELLSEITSRLTFLVDVGLDYLTLHRSAPTLSGGESQRIRLASQLGSGLTGVLYVLDEPTIGLHPRDNRRLIDALHKLRRLGNTLLVVEHDREVIAAADHVLDFGPGAGKLGGEVTAAAAPRALRAKPASLTGRYLAGKLAIPVPTNRRPVGSAPAIPENPLWRRRLAGAKSPPGATMPDGGSEDRSPVLTIHGARENNLKGIDVAFPLGRFTCVTGVSGSGKSSLVTSILYPALALPLHRARVTPGGHDRVSGLEHVDKVINVDQSPIGASPTSTPVTYTGAFDAIRELFARLPDAKVRGYTAGRFSFNAAGGRCEHCQGMGQRCIEMHFLPDVWIDCEACGGSRYSAETLDVRFRGKSIADVLTMSVSDARALFENIPKVRRMLDTLDDVGLGYLPLGQPAPTLSGGEAQRVKLATELGRPQTGKTLYILDEPTTGLHFDDIRKLLVVIHRLVDLGNTCVCIEHNLDVIKTCDWIIDLGPEAGDAGGHVVAACTPEDLVNVAASHTGRALAPVLAAGPHQAREVYDPARRAREEAELRRPVKLEETARMPWQTDGVRWHTAGQRELVSEPVHWDAQLLTWLVESMEKAGDFAPADWNHPARVEITGRVANATWFCHIRTRSTDHLDISIRVPRGTFAEADLVKRLAIPTYDERADLPIYGQWPRVRLRPAQQGFDEIRLHPCDFKDVSKTVWRAFLRDAAAAYGTKSAALVEPGAGRPWETDGLNWHMGLKAMPAHHAPRWSPATLMSLVGRFKSLDPTLAVNWNTKSAVLIEEATKRRSDEATEGRRIEGLRDHGISIPQSAIRNPQSAIRHPAPLIRIVTNSAKGLRVEIRAPKNVVTPVQIDRLGRDPNIRRGPDHDIIQFWIQQLEDLDPAQLRHLWASMRP